VIARSSPGAIANVTERLRAMAALTWTARSRAATCGVTLLVAIALLIDAIVALKVSVRAGLDPRSALHVVRAVFSASHAILYRAPDGKCDASDCSVGRTQIRHPRSALSAHAFSIMQLVSCELALSGRISRCQ